MPLRRARGPATNLSFQTGAIMRYRAFSKAVSLPSPPVFSVAGLLGPESDLLLNSRIRLHDAALYTSGEMLKGPNAAPPCIERG